MKPARRYLQRFVPALVVSVLVAASAPAISAAKPARPRVRFEAAREAPVAGCPSAPALREMVILHLGYDPFDDRAAAGVSCDITRVGDRLKAVIVMRDARGGVSGRRELVTSGAQCSDLAGAAALALAIAVDPTFATAAGEGGPEPARPRASTPARSSAAASDSAPPVAADPAATVVSETAPPQPAPRPPPEPTLAVSTPAPPPVAAGNVELPAPVRLALGVGPVIARGFQPGLGLGASLMLTARRRDLALGIEALFHAPGPIRYEEGEVTGQMLGAAVSFCGYGDPFQLCGVLTAGALRGAARDLPEARRGLTPMAAAGLRLGWQYELGKRWSILLHAGASVSLVRTTLWIADVAVWTSSRVTPHGGVLVVHVF